MGQAAVSVASCVARSVGMSQRCCLVMMIVAVINGGVIDVALILGSGRIRCVCV